MPVLALRLSPTTAYAADDSEPAADDDPALAKAWAAGDAKGIDDYTTTARLSCFCPHIPARTHGGPRRHGAHGEPDPFLTLAILRHQDV